MKNKIKTRKSFAKRVMLMASGALKRKQSHRSHLAAHKTTKQKRQLRSSVFLNKPQMKNAMHLLQK